MVLPYLKDGELTFVYDCKNLVNHGIVPVAMDGWYDLQVWRLFKSSNPAVISHEDLRVTRQTESKAVTLTSYLSSETLGKYAEKHPQNADFQKLDYQPVTASLMVRGTNPTSVIKVVETLNVSFRLQSADRTWLSKIPISGLAEGSTVFDLFTKVLRDNGYTYHARGSYIDAITTPSGKTLSELDAGTNSGWMYKVNGTISSAYMAAHALKNGDNGVVFFTKDYTKETPDPGSGWNQPVPAEEAAKVVSWGDGTYSITHAPQKASSPRGSINCGHGLQSKPPVELVVCTSPRRAYYWQRLKTH